MVSILICSKSSIPELHATLLWRDHIRRRAVTNIKDALSRAQAESPQIVVIDGGFPGAFELIDSLRSTSAPVPTSIVVVLREGVHPGDEKRFVDSSNLVLRPPAGPDWDEGLSALVSVSARRAIRVPVGIEFSGAVGGGSARITGMAHNLSASGMLVECVMAMKVGAPLSFSFSLPDGEQVVSGKGRVVREQPPSPAGVTAYGVAFDALDPASTNALRWFLEPSEGSFYDAT
jgi:hypothetical protein